MEKLSPEEEYWDGRYRSENTGWDLGRVSPPIYEYFRQIESKDISILIPGCGNSYEAEALLSLGFENITLIDLSPTLTDNLRQKFSSGDNHIEILTGDFFDHRGKYDIIVEQTFFCAIDTAMRSHYVKKAHELLTDKGKLIGLLFDRSFASSPPFGGTLEEYITLFAGHFVTRHMERCYNSVTSRDGYELFISLVKR
ncbi:methyltransferase [Pedobacter sp.]|uniref:methyltransferase n=1 Tax=Pedobacter sp. TaxID=1411316 RepID=UPI003C580E15